MGKQLDFNDIDIYRVLSALHEGVVISDHTGRVIFFNEGQSKIDDFTREEALGKKITDLYQLDDDTSPTMRCLNTGKPIINETLVYQTRLGRVSNIISNVYPLYKNRRLIGAINFSKDYQLLERTMVSGTGPERGDKKRAGNGTRFSFQDIIASSSEMINAIRIAKMSSSSPSPIMISGETGTGKELFAQSIHNHSPRAKKSFIPLNCAAIPENLLEGILFGTSKGSFTGAIEKRGLFEQADGGSIFLDELDSMPLTLQAKLLRVVQEKKVRKLGSLVEKDLDVKILSSVAQPPMDIIKKGSLRMDLFYRMGVVSVLLPPLRERKEEIQSLVKYFIAKYNRALVKKVGGISMGVEDLLVNYHWPGNVRELEHIIEASMNMVGTDQTIRRDHLPPHIFTSSHGQAPISRSREPGDLKSLPMYQVDGTSLFEAQASSEQRMICSALEKTRGNAAMAARNLGVSPQAFHYKLKKYKINRKAFSAAVGSGI
ncbi:sigma-54 interaction domain-containing protein [Desulfospira joergensenii]|uniref:sigma-54 interaction domain-containing protein n=1 Tax=Desulfospira joergensenii TaxID=53329 RepID=UPI0006882F48|nr:sigma-54-dependent Fis family transcriptional regulator [Desulfospira joergensenii]